MGFWYLVWKVDLFHGNRLFLIPSSCSIPRDRFNRPSSLSECITCSRVTGLSMKCSRTQLFSFRVFSLASTCTCSRRYVASGGLPQTPATNRQFSWRSGQQSVSNNSLQPRQEVAKTALYGLGATVFGHTCHTAISHTTLSHITLSPSHNLSSTISTQLTHTFSHTTCSHTTFSQATLSRATLSYVPVSHNLPSVISCLFVALPIPSSPFFCNLLEESWHVELSGPLILKLTWWNSQPMVPKFHVRYLVWLASGVQPHSAISKHDVPRSMRMHREHIQYKTFAYFRSYFNAKIHERTKLPCDQQRPWASNLALPNR